MLSKTKFSLLILVLTMALNIHAQNIGINETGANPNASAMLDIVADDKGILVPRVNIIDLSTNVPVTAPETSLLVYNTNVASGVGYYFWDGVKWVKIKDVNSNADHDWYEVGGTSDPDAITDDIFTQGDVGIGLGTIPANTKLFVYNQTGDTKITIEADPTNADEYDNPILEFVQDGKLIKGSIGLNHSGGTGFLGTPIVNFTGSNSLILNTYASNPSAANARIDLATLDTIRMTINGTGGNVGIGTTTPSHTLHVSEAENVTTGRHEIARFATDNLKSGVAIGYRADGTNSEGGYIRSLGTATGGSDLFLGTNIQNQAITLLDANGNIGIGIQTPVHQLEVYETNPIFAMRIFNRNDASGNGLLIESNGASDDDTLIRVKGDLNGAPRELLTLIGDGRMGINTGNPNPITKLDVEGYMIGQNFLFSSYSNNQVVDFADGVVSFTQASDPHNDFATNTYTAPVDGYYFFTTNIQFDGGDGADDTIFISFLRDGIGTNAMAVNPRFISTADGLEANYTHTALLPLTAGQTVSVGLSNVSAGNPVDYQYRSFMGYMISK